MIELWTALALLAPVLVFAGLLLIHEGNLGPGMIGAAIVVALLARIEQAARYQ